MSEDIEIKQEESFSSQVDESDSLSAEEQVENDINNICQSMGFSTDGNTLLQQKVFICSVCHKTFGKKNNLNNHFREVHNKEKNHFCPFCNKGFFRKSYLSKHSCGSKMKPKPETELEDVEENENDSIQLALLCKQELDVDEDVGNDSNPFDFDCKQELIGDDEPAEDDHLHFLCKQEEEEDESNQELNANDLDVPEDEKLDYKFENGMFSCPVCEKQFKMKKNVNLHIREVHNQEKNYFCPICNKGFFKKTYLQKHHKLSKICGSTEKVIKT